MPRPADISCPTFSPRPQDAPQDWRRFMLRTRPAPAREEAAADRAGAEQQQGQQQLVADVPAFLAGLQDAILATGLLPLSWHLTRCASDDAAPKLRLRHKWCGVPVCS